MLIDWTTVWAPLTVGVSLWLVAEGVREILSRVTRRRSRRRQILSLMGRARAVAFRAIRDGQFDSAYISRSLEPIAAARAQYDDLTAEALELFERGEEDVAFWAGAEFYAGWLEPFRVAEDAAVPHKLVTGEPIFDVLGLYRDWELARPEHLIAWSDAPWPLARGGRRGPRYGSAYSTGDVSRHRVVIPNADANGDMLLSWVSYLPDKKPHKPRGRELRRLRKMYPEHAEKYARLPERAR